MFCPNCGALVKDNAKFCENCGSRVDMQESNSSVSDAFYGAAGEGRIAPGFSRIIDSEPVRKALDKQRKTVFLTSVILSVLPLIGFLIYGAVSDKMDIGNAVLTGLAVSAIFALTSIIVTVKKRLEKTFVGVVADKKHIHHISSSSRRGGRSRNEWKLIIDCEDGRRRRKKVAHSTYDYLEVGDKVRYLPQFPHPFEKYDKSRDAAIPCLFCGVMNPAGNDACKVCKNPLIK